MSDTMFRGPITVEMLAGSPRRHTRERVMHAIFMAAALVSVAISAAIVWSLLRDAIDFLVHVDYGSLWTSSWNPRQGEFDLKTVFVGSLIITAVAMLVAIPIGLASAVYLSEYASVKVRRVLKPILEVLAGIPSVVLGWWALTTISPDLVQKLFNSAEPQNFAAAGIATGVLVVPLIASVAEDALNSVPKALREASAGLGARKMTTSIKVVMPAAVSGIVAAVIIGVSRAIGETMVAKIAAGAASSAQFTASPIDGGLSVTSAMTSVIGTDQVAGDAAGLTYSSLFFLGMLLFIVTLGLNMAADRFVRRVREVY